MIAILPLNVQVRGSVSWIEAQPTIAVSLLTWIKSSVSLQRK